MNCAALPLIGMALLCFGGCVYTSSGGYLTAAEGYGSPTFPPPVWDESAKAFRQDFPARCYYHRRGVYPKGTKLTPGGAHWGVVGDMIEGLAHLPTFWLEMLLWADRESYYDVVFLDRNSKRGDIELLALPDCAFDDRLLRQEAFRPYWTNTVFGIDFDEGEIYINGTSIKEDPIACKRQLAYLPDNPDLYDYMSGIQYLNFVADIFGVSQQDREERIHRYAQMLEIESDLAQSIGAYSHGMKQKLALISALVHAPKLLIMDEPFVGLDPKASRQLKDTMREICDQGGAIFFSTHVLEVAERLCDKVAIIKDGVLMKHGTMEEVRGDESLESVFLELEEGQAYDDE